MGLSDDTASSYTALSSEALQIATSLSSSSAAGLTPALNMDSVVFDSDKAQHTSPDSDTDSVSSFDSAHPPSATRPFLAAANGKGLGAHMGAFSPSPRVCGKRGRSRSSSFASDGGSSVTSSGSGDSIFSRGCESGEDTPLSSQGSSASSSGSGDEDSPGRGARKAPRCRRSETAGGAAAAVAHVSSDSEVELHRLARLRGAGLACDLADMGLDVAAVDDVKSADIGSEREGKRGADSTLESQTQSAVFGLAGDSRSGKSSFVDNLVGEFMRLAVGSNLWFISRFGLYAGSSY